jgi:arabinose-5-phosphate isomerase
MIDLVKQARDVFDKEIEVLQQVKEEINGEFECLVNMILGISGRVVVTGMGKSGHIGRKIAATLSSLGVPSYFLHPSEGAHGDLGMITKNDILIAISSSGETDEILQLIPSIKRIEAQLVSITCKPDSTLAKYSNLNINLNVSKEACNLNLAPTSSTTATLVFGDALAIVLSKLIGFTKENFAVFHPKGTLGRKLLTKVSDLMKTGQDNPIVKIDAKVKEAIFEISSKGMGAVNVVDKDYRLVGIITDGDLRRSIENYDNILEEKVSSIMTGKPLITKPDTLAVNALTLMEKRKKPIMVLPVVDDENMCVGIININDIINSGVV